MSGKWTPGPWRADLGETYRVCSPQNRSIAWATFVFSSGRREIGEVAANAYLMSAAPELAEALEAMVERFGHEIFTMWPEDRDLLTRAAAVLAKAKGEGA